MNEYNSMVKPNVAAMLEHAKTGMPQEQLLAELATMTDATDAIAADMRDLTQERLEVMSAASDGAIKTRLELLFIIIAIIIVALSISIFLALYISGLISKPLAPLTTFMKQASSTGDIDLRPDDIAIISKYGLVKDELGQLIEAAASFVQRVNGVSKTLETIADGDLTAEIVSLSDKDVLGLSLQKIVASLNRTFSEFNISAARVSTNARHVSYSAQTLAQGATEQAASIEELSSSITEVAGNTKKNASKAGQATKLADTIKGNAEKGRRQMDEMMSAVSDINQSSKDIGKVIKVIDDIAFQTNILALNAAVEAARAGQHGKGFAVVASEVRNLAAKSAEAAKGTGTLIANSIDKAEHGVRIAEETSASLEEIVSGINESGQLVMEIAQASEEQSLAISQINIGVDQVAQVVQQNSATAEESAAASEEMSSQATLLQELIAQFKIKDA
jgi:methyl-accepting chemotaxis protein